MNREQLKNMAKEQIKGKTLTLFGIVLVGLIICLVALYIPMFVAIITFVIGGAASILGVLLYIVGFVAYIGALGCFSISMVTMYLNLTKGIQPQFSDLKIGLKNYKSNIILLLLTFLYTLLWMLLFYVPGIIKAISYSMAPYILAENPDMKPSDAIKESMLITNGRKWEIFVLELSFIGWILLSCVTCNLSMIYVMPYMQATYANYYNSIKRNIAITENTDNSENV